MFYTTLNQYQVIISYVLAELHWKSFCNISLSFILHCLQSCLLQLNVQSFVVIKIFWSLFYQLGLFGWGLGVSVIYVTVLGGWSPDPSLRIPSLNTWFRWCSHTEANLNLAFAKGKGRYYNLTLLSMTSNVKIIDQLKFTCKGFNPKLYIKGSSCVLWNVISSQFMKIIIFLKLPEIAYGLHLLIKWCKYYCRIIASSLFLF